ncbi:hypothetical protein MN608_07423 [Microdochium nivale]|nr:hypothetical protein MN608_07423 [Microdochium nivale]
MSTIEHSFPALWPDELSLLMRPPPKLSPCELSKHRQLTPALPQQQSYPSFCEVPQRRRPFSTPLAVSNPPFPLLPSLPHFTLRSHAITTQLHPLQPHVAESQRSD